jgi:hypothetical protein
MRFSNSATLTVMARLDPAIDEFAAGHVDARIKSGHDGFGWFEKTGLAR